MLRLTFLGTSAGLPTKQRNVSAMALEWVASVEQKCGDWLLIDCGEGTQHQLLKSTLEMKRLRAILITHLHGDHCFGLAGLLSSLAMQGRTEPLLVLAPSDFAVLWQAYQSVCALYLPYRIDLVAIERLDGKLNLPIASASTFEISVVPLSHRIASFAFCILAKTKKEKIDSEHLKALGVEKKDWHTYLKQDSRLLITHETSQKIVIAGDNDTPALLKEALADADCLVHECTYTQAVLDNILQKGVFDPMHTSAKMIGEFAESMALPKLILTHFSARYALFDDKDNKTPNMGHIREEVLRHYRGELVLAEDFLRVLI